MSQSTISARVDSEDKLAFDNFCKKVGMNSSTVINMFIKKVIRDDCIPFEITGYKTVSLNEGYEAFLALREEAKKNGLQDMSIEEINKIIAETRAERYKKEGK